MKLETRPDIQAPAPQVPGTAKGRLSIVPLIVVAIISLLIGYAAGAAGTDSDTTPVQAETAAPDDQVGTEPSPEPSPEAPATFALQKSDIELDLKVLSKENFGSAGALIEYRVEVAMAPGVSSSLPEDGVWEVSYQILGGEDGAEVGTLNIYGTGEYDVNEGVLSTPNVATVGRVKILEIEDISNFG